LLSVPPEQRNAQTSTPPLRPQQNAGDDEDRQRGQHRHCSTPVVGEMLDHDRHDRSTEVRDNGHRPGSGEAALASEILRPCNDDSEYDETCGDGPTQTP
jgi:hypothetical protein